MDTNKREKENRRTADARGFTQIKTEVQNSRENAQKDVKKRTMRIHGRRFLRAFSAKRVF
jgi:hypothetical protein